MRIHRLLTAAAIAAATVLVPAATPAGAAVVTSTLGTTITATASGDTTIAASCLGNLVAINGAIPVPPVQCSTFSLLTVNGDSGKQVVTGGSLNSFASQPKLKTALGDGADTVFESRWADDLDLGPGADGLVLDIPGTTNTELDLGSGADTVKMFGTGGDDSVSVSSTGPDATILIATGQGPVVKTVKAVELVTVEAIGGNDVLTGAGVTPASNLTSVFLVGGEGNDTITASYLGGPAYGGTGTNTFNGGTGADLYTTDSTTDVIHLGGGATNSLFDTSSLRSGGRAIDGTGDSDQYLSDLGSQDTIVRVRPGIQLNTARFTASLNRGGQQAIPANFDRVRFDFDPQDSKTDRSIADVVAVHQAVTIDSDDGNGDLLDVTIPSGAWTTDLHPGDTSTIDPQNAAYGTITISNLGPVSIHGPWPDANTSFAQRVIRDLQFRLPTDLQRNAVRDALTGGTKTRPQVIAELIDTDLYRGLDVDRTFVDYLDRQADPSGRTYWIKAIRDGRSLQQFRAELFGSNEYFNRAGATNSAYVFAAYRDVLGRAPDAAGRAYWVNKITNGTPRSKVAKQFLNSTEARRFIVEDQYLRFLDRLPTADESTAGMATISATADGEQRLIAQLTATSAYHQRN